MSGEKLTVEDYLLPPTKEKQTSVLTSPHCSCLSSSN